MSLVPPSYTGPVNELSVNSSGNASLHIFLGKIPLNSRGKNGFLKIDAAADGDTVLVTDGTCTGNGKRDMDFLGDEDGFKFLVDGGVHTKMNLGFLYALKAGETTYTRNMTLLK